MSIPCCVLTVKVMENLDLRNTSLGDAGHRKAQSVQNQQQQKRNLGTSKASGLLVTISGCDPC